MGRLLVNNSFMRSGNRVPEIRRLLETALDNDEEYLYEGEMSSYPRWYASDAVSDLRTMFAAFAPTAEEIALCVTEISKPERIANGKSKRFLLALGDRSRPVLDALSESSDSQLRLFALEAGGQWTNSLYYSPVYSSVEMEIRLLEDPDEVVRLAAVQSASETLRHNAKSLGFLIENNEWFARLYKTLVELLDDASPEVRAAVAEALDGGQLRSGE